MLEISRILKLDNQVREPLDNVFLDEDSVDSWGSRDPPTEWFEENARALEGAIQDARIRMIQERLRPWNPADGGINPEQIEG